MLCAGLEKSTRPPTMTSTLNYAVERVEILTVSNITLDKW